MTCPNCGDTRELCGPTVCWPKEPIGRPLGPEESALVEAVLSGSRVQIVFAATDLERAWRRAGRIA